MHHSGNTVIVKYVVKTSVSILQWLELSRTLTETHFPETKPSFLKRASVVAGGKTCTEQCVCMCLCVNLKCVLIYHQYPVEGSVT